MAGQCGIVVIKRDNIFKALSNAPNAEYILADKNNNLGLALLLRYKKAAFNAYIACLSVIELELL